MTYTVEQMNSILLGMVRNFASDGHSQSDSVGAQRARDCKARSGGVV
eukprot:CAMPEP_0197418436 /NCGR_PEP_ID=MMETSP1170-20131217/4161_1 /TAXON_ID=54406 /ORGANISM="Sarcinochrysis sp, Strain CCMP770" /LENGTH=46 /DNA_ID= /DNA_START= /DNA_END= /DNA_ORIENTATION=